MSPDNPGGPPAAGAAEAVDTGPGARPPRRRGCWLAIALLVILGLCGGSAVGVLRSLADEPNSIRLDVTVEREELVVGDTVLIEMTVENVDVDPVTITGVGLDHELLDGLSLGTIDPAYRSSEDRSFPFVGEWHEYAFTRQLQGGETLDIVITLLAEERGSYSGDLSVWIEYDMLGWEVSRARREELDFQIR